MLPRMYEVQNIKGINSIHTGVMTILEIHHNYFKKSICISPTNLLKNLVKGISTDKNFMQHPCSIVIFIDIARRDSNSTYPIINRVSDHDAQSITFNTITLKPPTKQAKPSQAKPSQAKLSIKMEISSLNKTVVNKIHFFC